MQPRSRAATIRPKTKGAPCILGELGPPPPCVTLALALATKSFRAAVGPWTRGLGRGPGARGLMPGIRGRVPAQARDPGPGPRARARGQGPRPGPKTRVRGPGPRPETRGVREVRGARPSRREGYVAWGFRIQLQSLQSTIQNGNVIRVATRMTVVIDGRRHAVGIGIALSAHGLRGRLTHHHDA